MELEISRDEFRAFLERNPDRTFLAVTPCECPLAGFLNRDEFGDERWAVTPKYCRHNGNNWFTPPWVREFVYEVDRSRHIGDRITGAEALMILDSVECEE